MSSKKKSKPATAAKRQPAKKPATNGERRQKANVTRFCRDVSDEYRSEYPNATVYKLRRALAQDNEMRDAITALGSRAWLQTGFRDRMDALVKNLPTTTFRRAMSPAERAAANAARQDALLSDVKGYTLSLIHI